MVLRKIGKYYHIDLRIDGQRFRRSLKTDDYNKAFDKYNEEKKKILIELNKTEVNFEDFCSQYLEWAWETKPASTPREKQRLEIIKIYFKEWGIVNLSDVTPLYIERLKSELKTKRISKERIGLSKASINRYLQILRGMFNRAIDWEIYDKANPLKKIKFLKESPQVIVLSPAQVKKIITAAKEISKNPHSPVQRVFYDISRLALLTGLRKTEVLTLRWKDVKEKKVIIKGKGDKVREVPLNEIAKKIIHKYPPKDEYVFDVSNRYQKDILRRTVDRVKKQTGINFHFHLLRHRFATSLVEKGVDFVTISEILGHSKITTSLRYSHSSEEKMLKAVESLKI